MELGFVDKDSIFVDQLFSWTVSDLLDHFFMNKTLDEVGASCKSYDRHCRLGKLYGPFCFINISEGREEKDDNNHGCRNLVEVALVIKIVQRLYQEWRGCSQQLHVTVISPYAAQVAEIERRLGETFGNLINFVLTVKTTEEFQNDEADVVVLSTVKSNCTESSNFTSHFQKSNDLFSRARHCLWILGSANALSQVNSLWETVITNAKKLRCLLNANEDEEMAQIITNVKSQLDELEDLLDMKSLIFKDARWKVMFSEIFVKSFSKLPSTYSKKIVLNFLLKLANGWRPRKYKADATGSSLSIVKQYRVEGCFIICTNDICKDSGYESQVLKVWDILHLVDVPPLVKKLENLYRTFPDDYLKRCKAKALEGYLEIPRCYYFRNDSWHKGINNSDLTDFSCGTSYTENSKVKESLLLMKFYSFSAGVVSHLLSACDGTPINVPFEVTNQEREIILHQRSSFVLGRSGTGKTTVLVMKLFQKEQLHQMASEGFSELNSIAVTSNSLVFQMGTSGTSMRQLFVTVNPKLCIAVKRHISNFQRFTRGENFGEERITVNVSDLDEDANFNDIPTSFLDSPQKMYPLVVTYKMFLLVLDRTIGTSYFSRFPDIRKIYSQETPGSRSIHQKLVKRREVGYEKFRESYWPHFNMKLTHKLDPSRVFTEINTHIKGSLHFRQIGETTLSLEKYIQLSDKKGSSFDKLERSRIYDIFLDYEKMKVTREEFDLSDLVNDIYHRFKHDKYEGDLMDFVYVDEVQDLTMKQLVILKYICKNVKEGFVFAGDTAQTIAKGVHFRFEDIKCLFYKEFLHEERQELNWNYPLLKLTQNFRTHAGVLNLAQSITELIYHFFPESIDKLNPETSLVRGEAPVFLDSGCDGDAMSVIFGNRGNNIENLTSFGSEQVILVRDDYVKGEITKHIGKRAIVLTIFECKGLEFQDVLLYNFFGTSPLEDQWRIIYEYMVENRLLPAKQESLPQFSHSKHNILCYELKQLYVAVTRAKQRLWICEESDGFSLPMVRYWQKLNTIQVKELDESYAREMPIMSSAYDWKLQGFKMLEVQNYKIAAQCFIRAGENDWETYTRASELKEAAQNVRNLSVEKSLIMLEEAAQLFESIGNRKKAAECYLDAEDFEKAGLIYIGESDNQRAGQCFTLAGRYETAAEIYAKANLFDECLDACSKGKLFDLGLQYIRTWRRDLNDLIQEAGMDINANEQKFLEKCAYAAYKQQDKLAMMKHVKDFRSFELMVSFLIKWDCQNELLDLLIDLEKYIDAAKLARHMGNIIVEANLLEKGHHYQEVSSLCLDSVLAGSLWADDGEGWPLKDFPSKEELSLKAKASASRYTPHFHEIVSANIQLLSYDKYGFHDLQQLLTLSRKNRNLMGEILANWKVLDLLLSYSEVKGPKNKVPITKLCWHWNLWKDNVGKILSYLRSLKRKEPAEYTEHGEFCLKYLGVRERANDKADEGYFMLYPDAKWVKTIPRRSDKKDSLTKWQLMNAGERYWSSELLVIGRKVLDTLELVLKLGARSSMPVYYHHYILVQIFQTAAFLLMHCRFLKPASIDWHSLMSYIDISAEQYFASVFSLDKMTLVTKESIIQAGFSRNILRDAILRRFSSLLVYGDVSVKKKPSLVQLVQVVVVLMGSSVSSKQLSEHYEEIPRKFQVGSPWQPLLNDLVKGAGQICHFRDALRETYKSKSKGYHLVSPSCFVYLLERLLVMVSSSHGCLFATRSSFIDWLIYLDWMVDPDTFLPGSEETSLEISTYDFLAETVHELLVNRQDMEEWVHKNGPKHNQSLPTVTSSTISLLSLKLVILLGLICLNTGCYSDLLDDALLRCDVTEQLPTEFQEVVIERNWDRFQNVIAEVLKSIGDGLVVVRNERFAQEMCTRNAVFLNVYRLRKNKILEKLCQRSD
ncbi:uncharacterized protein LOC141587273 [Silene latifolia]|uniref:uncharacterized protein LOC141587273 n=1 Tax=Silene latifolia TaxID=37657 RepID=UPI003D76C37B